MFKIKISLLESSQVLQMKCSGSFVPTGLDQRPKSPSPHPLAQLSSLRQKHPLAFSQIFGSDEEIADFWAEKDLQDPAFLHHPALVKPGFRAKCVPLKLHSDGVVMSKQETLHVISWSSYFGKGSILEWQLLFAAVVKSARRKRQGRETLNEIYRCLRWSLSACLAGVHPGLDHNNNAWPPQSARAMLAQQPLDPNGKFLAVLSILGDLDELCNTLGLAHFNSASPCFWCGCNTRDVPWTDSSPDAAWRATTLQPQPDMPVPSALEIWQILGVTIFSVGWDILHGLDLGPTQHVLGNCLEDLLRTPAFGNTIPTRLKGYGQELSRSTRTCRFRTGSLILELSNFRHAGDYPRLKAKGNESRHFVPVVQQLLLQMGESWSQCSRHRNEMLVALVRFYEIVDVHDFFLTRAKAEEGERVLMTFLQQYSRLAKKAVEQGQLRWQLAIKFHYVAHAAALLKWANVRHSSTGICGEGCQNCIQCQLRQATPRAWRPPHAENPSRKGHSNEKRAILRTAALEGRVKGSQRTVTETHSERVWFWKNRWRGVREHERDSLRESDSKRLRQRKWLREKPSERVSQWEIPSHRESESYSLRESEPDKIPQRNRGIFKKTEWLNQKNSATRTH